VKFLVTPDSGTPEEKVIALPHPALLNLTAKHRRKLTDPLCRQLAAAHLKHMIQTSEDMDKTLVTVSAEELSVYDQQLHGETLTRHG
jgi:hypothetical protein